MFFGSSNIWLIEIDIHATNHMHGFIHSNDNIVIIVIVIVNGEAKLFNWLQKIKIKQILAELESSILKAKEEYLPYMSMYCIMVCVIHVYSILN